MARVVLEHLSKFFTGPRGERVQAVDQVDLQVEDQELLVLLGPSGCGKTTLLRLVAGVEELSEGSISIDGKVMNQVEPRDREVAMVFQKDALYPHLNVYENIGFGLTLRKYPRAEIEKRVSETAQSLGLEGWLERKPHELSVGQRQRVALGRALVRRPKLFLLDEPLSNLDRPMRLQMRAEISKLHRQLGATMIYVTHDQAEAMMLGDRIGVMKAGRIQQVGSPSEVYQRPGNTFVAGFMGAPPMNLFTGRVVLRGSELVFEEHTASNPKERMTLRLEADSRVRSETLLGKDIVLGMRAENMAVSLNANETTEPLVAVTVELIEPIGAETWIHASTAAHALVIRAGVLKPFTVGEQLRVKFDMRQAHFFDRATGCRIE